MPRDLLLLLARGVPVSELSSALDERDSRAGEVCQVSGRTQPPRSERATARARRHRVLWRRRLAGLTFALACLLIALLSDALAGGSPKARQPARHQAAPPLASAATRDGKTSATEAPTANLLAGSDPSVLPGPILIADRDNNRLSRSAPRDV